MPAYIHHHEDAEPAFIICPSCVGLPMYVKDIEPHWSITDELFMTLVVQ